MPLFPSFSRSTLLDEASSFCRGCEAYGLEDVFVAQRRRIQAMGMSNTHGSHPRWRHASEDNTRYSAVPLHQSFGTSMATGLGGRGLRPLSISGVGLCIFVCTPYEPAEQSCQLASYALEVGCRFYEGGTSAFRTTRTCDFQYRYYCPCRCIRRTLRFLLAW